VLRQKYVEFRVDSLYGYDTLTHAYTFIIAVKDSSLKYYWYANSLGTALFQIDMDSNWAAVKSALWLKVLPTSTGAVSRNNNDLSIFPNPATDELNILRLTDDIEIMSVYDGMGRLVGQITLNERITKIPATNYATGLYMYRVADKNNTVLTTGKFMISK
jgi:hypothetical protein